MALLQDQIRTTNSKLDELTRLVEETLASANKSNAAMAVVDRSIKENLSHQQQEMSEPIASMGAKVDALSNEFRFVRESVADVTSRIGKLQTQVTDLKSTMQVLSAPPSPPPGQPGQTTSSVPATTTSAATLLSDARRDQSGGRLDLALAQYQQFLVDFPNADQAPAAQFGIGEIYYAQQDFKQAVEAFDLVLEKYPENEKTPDAMYMKAMSFAKTGQTKSAAIELRALLNKYPNSSIAQQAKSQLTELGFSTP